MIYFDIFKYHSKVFICLVNTRDKEDKQNSGVLVLALAVSSWPFQDYFTFLYLWDNKQKFTANFCLWNNLVKVQFTCL